MKVLCPFVCSRLSSSSMWATHVPKYAVHISLHWESHIEDIEEIKNADNTTSRLGTSVNYIDTQGSTLAFWIAFWPAIQYSKVDNHTCTYLHSSATMCFLIGANFMQLKVNITLLTVQSKICCRSVSHFISLHVFNVTCSIFQYLNSWSCMITHSSRVIGIRIEVRHIARSAVWNFTPHIFQWDKF